MNTTEQDERSRVMHVPLSDAEWHALRRLSFDSNLTLGALAAIALRAAYPLTEGTK